MSLSFGIYNKGRNELSKKKDEQKNNNKYSEGDTFLA